MTSTNNSENSELLGSVSQPRILVVDDEPLIRAGIRALLNKEGYLLQFAEDGHEGLELAMKDSPDVILLDVMMPGMDGFEFCRRIRQSEGIADVPIVFISALDDKEARLKGFEAGADEYLAKPFDGRELRYRLRTLTRLNRYRKILSEQKRFEWVFENSPDGLVALDAEGRITNLNQSATAWLGCNENPCCESRLLKVCLENKYKLLESIETSEQDEVKSVARTEIWFMEETSQSKSITLEVRYGTPSGLGEGSIVAQIREITDQDEFRTMSQVFMNLISHKMLTPLNIMQGAIEVLKMDHPEIFEEEYGNYLQDGLDQMLSQTRKILSFTTYHFSDPNASCPLSELQGIVKEVTKDVGLQTEPSCEIKVADPMLRMKLSRESLILLFMEAFGNSKKFHPENKPVIHVQVEPINQEELCLTVMDNGISLSPKQLSEALKPFVQGEKYFTGNVPGWGIGLTLVKRVIEKAGGSVELRNREDSTGVCLLCKLPCVVIQE